MALRLIIYYLDLLQLWFAQNGINIFGYNKIETMPIPEFYVVYNGTAPIKEPISDIHIQSDSMLIKATVNIIDIRFNKLGNTEPDNALAGYSYFYKVYDEHRHAGISDTEAFDNARQACIAKGYLKGFIDREDFIMFYKEFVMDYDRQLKEEAKYLGRLEGIQEGKLEGIQEGKLEGAEATITVAIKSKAPYSLLEAMAKEANLPRTRLDELMAQAAV